MKYSILGFDQNKVLGLIDKVNANREKGQHIYIDVDDLLILSEVADLENRKSIRKIILDDGQYSWISYNLIIDDLPILRIGKKQLSRKIDKLAEFNLIELRVERIKGSGTFIYIRTGNEYEGLLYGNKGGGQKCTEGMDKNVYGDGQKCPPKDNITIQDNNNNKEERDKSLSKKASNSTWRADIEVYRKEVEDAKEQLINDTEFKAKFMNMYPNADYLRSIMKSMQYWTSEKAWELKKKGKSSKINMLATLKNNLEKSVVYKNSQDQPIENLRMLNIEYKDKQEGTLADGTFIKGAYRYYFSYREKRALSIPINAPMMPSERCEYDYNSKNWYLPRESETINDLLW